MIDQDSFEEIKEIVLDLLWEMDDKKGQSSYLVERVKKMDNSSDNYVCMYSYLDRQGQTKLFKKLTNPKARDVIWELMEEEI